MSRFWVRSKIEFPKGTRRDRCRMRRTRRLADAVMAITKELTCCFGQQQLPWVLEKFLSVPETTLFPERDHIADQTIGLKNSFKFFLISFGIFVWFFSWYHLPCISNSLELEPIILHGCCYILACSPSILHGICYICGTSTAHFVWYLLYVGAYFKHSFYMVFATCWYIPDPFMLHGFATCLLSLFWLLWLLWLLWCW